MNDLIQKFPLVFSFFENDEFAATTTINKYLLKNENGEIVENDPKDLIWRVLSSLAGHLPYGAPSKEWFDKNLANDKRFNDLTNLPLPWQDIFIIACDNFKGICPQGSILSAAGNTFAPQSLSNCFVIESPEDSISGIMKSSEEIAQLSKRRGGVGLDISTLRPCGHPVANAARSSSGAYGFMDLFSSICRSIGQNGRRGALMITLDIKHPDAELFAKAKRDLKYCTGANVSLKISDEFMKAVVNDEEFVQQWPIDSNKPTVIKKIRAKDLWKVVCESAWQMAEPGLLFWDNVRRNLPADFYNEYQTLSTNPCSELPLSKNDSCRLMTMCLTKYVLNKFSKQATFDFKTFETDVRIAMRMMDSVVSAEIAAIKKIITKIESDVADHHVELELWNKILISTVNGRRCGLGTHGLADCLAQLCLKYDSTQSLETVDKIYAAFRNAAYDESIEMAIEYGKFPAYDYEKEKACEYIQRLPDILKKKMKKYGRRNISLLTMAPTGTISILSQCSSGIEPSFRHMYTRRRKINSNDLDARIDFVDEMGDKWMHFPQFEKNVKLYFEVTGKTLPEHIKNDAELSELLPGYFVTSDKINWKKRIEMQSTIQKYIDHSISSTINLPKDVSQETVQELYEAAWKKDLKGLTIYRDGCRTGVLITDTNEKPKNIQRVDAPERPNKLPCEVRFTKVKGEDYVVIVGLLNGSVYEVFFGKYDNQIPSKTFHSFIEKKGKSKYYLTFIEDVDIKQIDINKYFDNKDYEAATRLISTALRHGTPLYYVVDQLQKSSPSMFEYGAAISRVLKKYIKIEDMKKYTSCENCGSKNVQIKNENGCYAIICLDCSTINSKCN
jgi:ribonucleoside-diphosphate reductase alpha chain